MFDSSPGNHTHAAQVRSLGKITPCIKHSKATNLYTLVFWEDHVLEYYYFIVV